MQVTKKLLYIFSFLLLSLSIVSAENVCENLDGNYTFNETNTTTSFSNSNLDATQSDYYYFNVQTAGTIIIEFTSNPAGKILMDSSENSCVTGAGGVDDTIEISKNSAFDFNLGLYATQDSQYAFTVTFIPAPLTITKTVFPKQVEANNETSASYTIVISNNKETDLTNVHFTDVIPFASDDITNITYDHNAWTCSEPINSNLDCNLTTLSPEVPQTFTIDVNVDIDAGEIINSASVEAYDPGTTSATGTFTDTATIEAVTSNGPVDLEIQKFAEADDIPPGIDFVYAIFVTNHTQGKDAELVTVTDIFPSPEQNITFVSYDRGSGWDCDISNVENGTYLNNGTITCRFDRSMGHEITYFTITAHTDDGNYYRPGVENTASVSALSPITGEHDTEDTAIINIGDVIQTGGVIGNVYAQNGYVEASTVPLILGSNRSNAYLQTKVASTIDTTIGLYTMNTSHNVETYQNITSIEGNNKLVPLTVLLKLGNDNCTLMNDPSLTYNPDHRAVAIFDEGTDWYIDAEDSVTGGGNFNLRNIAAKKARIIMQYIDINAKLDDANESCKVSSIDGNIKGLPQCLTNSAGSNKFDNNKYINTFGIDAFVRCAIQNGQPCSSENNGYGDDPYDSEYGCYECTVGSSGSCSKDNFAIRPKVFDVNISDYINADGDVILKAGKEYDLGFRGLTAIADENTLDYNETQIPPGQSVGPLESDTFYIDANVTNNTNCEVKYLTNDPLVNFQDGVGVQGPIKFNDIGDINFTIHETNGTEFAIVDQNDTSLENRLIDEFNTNFTVIPDHFYIDANLTDHNTDANFTYLHDINTYDSEDHHSMASAFTVNIEARGADDDITSNYIEGCYAKETNLTLILDSTNITYPGSEPALTHFLYYNPLEDDGTPNSGEGNYSFPTPITSPISLPSLPIENATTSFPLGGYNETNGTTYIAYKLNFDRKVHLAVNPFKLGLSDVNITEIDTNITDPDYLAKGSANINQNATYYYARTQASKSFYEDVNSSNAKTPILINIYCNLGLADCSILGLWKDTNEMGWWLSVDHNITNGDGNVTLQEGIIQEGNSDNWSVTPDVINIVNGEDETILVSRGTTNLVLPLTVEIDLVDTVNPTDTSKWLIYNKDTDSILQAPPSPFYKVRFITPPADWAGQGDTGHVVESNASIIKNRRLGW